MHLLAAAPPASPFGSSSSSKGLGGPSFKGVGTTASPFGTTPSQRRSIEPIGLQPDMGPDPLQKETPISLLKSISLTQVVSRLHASAHSS